MKFVLRIFDLGRSTFRQWAVPDPITLSDLHDVAAYYNPDLYEAPIHVGPAQLNSHAFGWVQRLWIDGTKLMAEVDQVDPDFEAARLGGKFPRLCAHFYLPGAPNSPTPGKFHLRSVQFGDSPPVLAANGLRVVSFADAGAQQPRAPLSNQQVAAMARAMVVDSQRTSRPLSASEAVAIVHRRQARRPG